MIEEVKRVLSNYFDLLFLIISGRVLWPQIA